jgi:hypothetical protein
MKQFDKGWWKCFNSFANNTINDNGSICMEVLRGVDITKDEIEELLRSGDLYGNALNIVNEYLRMNI